MTALPEPLRSVLRDFCHNEWYEIDELAKIIASGEIGFDAKRLEAQLDALIESQNLPVDPINSLTENEFKSDPEARAWLIDIRSQAFPM